MRFTEKMAGALTIVVMILACAAAPATAQEPLRWRFEQGQKLEYDTVQEMNMSAKGTPLGDLTMTTRQQMDMKWEVLEVAPSGDARIRQTIDRVRIKMTAPMGQGMEYDSAAEEAPVGQAAAAAAMFDVLRKAEFELTLSPRGELKDAKVPEDVMNAFKSSPQAAQLGALLTPDTIQRNLMQETIVLPEEAPSAGHTWDAKTEVNIPGAGTQTVDTTYKFEGVKEVDGKKHAVITAQRDLEFAQAENQQVQIEIKEQSFEGEALFNVEDGRLGSIQFKQSVTMGASAAGQKMEQQMDQSSEVKLLPAE